MKFEKVSSFKGDFQKRLDSLENGSDESSIGNSFSKRDIIEL